MKAIQQPAWSVCIKCQEAQDKPICLYYPWDKLTHYHHNQGCSKKKVENIKELRPFIGWGDLVRKMQLSRQLSTDMLNETTKLLRMRDTVSKLMDKVCK